MSVTALNDLKVYELKAVCRAKGLKVSGRKAELVARLQDDDATALRTSAQWDAEEEGSSPIDSLRRKQSPAAASIMFDVEAVHEM